MRQIIDHCNALTMRCFAQAVELVMLRHKVKDLEAQLNVYHDAFGDVKIVKREHWM